MAKTRTKRSKKNSDDSEQPALNESGDANGTQIEADFIPLDDADVRPGGARQAAFFGLLDRSELEYFKTAESTLAAGALTAAERESFVESVLAEAKGKELKLFTNQVCSKLVERLLAAATDQQLVHLLKAVQGHLYALTLQKYSSHCVETLLHRAADLVERETRGDAALTTAEDNEVVPAETLVLFLVNELRPHVKEMAAEQYSSHVLRLLLLLLAGLPLSEDVSLRSRRSKDARRHIDMDANKGIGERTVPEAFTEAVAELVGDLTAAITDSREARRLACDKLASPLYQVVIRVQASRSAFGFVDLCFGADGSDPEATESFFRHLLSDAVGSYFLQSVIETLPRKKLLALWQTRLKGKVAALASKEPSSFVVQALLRSKLGPKIEVVFEIIPAAGEIMAANQFGVLEAALEAADAKQTAELSRAIVDSVGGMAFVLGPPNSKDTPRGSDSREDRSEDRADSRGSIRGRAQLVEKLAEQPKLLADAAKTLTAERFRDMALNPVQSHVLEALLRPEMDIVERRKLLNIVVPLATELAVSASGSHVVDALWQFCYKLKFARERLATELAGHGEELKQSPYGRNVWKNWNLDKYIHKQHEWWTKVKANEDELKAKLGDEPKEKQDEKRKGPVRTRQSHPPKKPYSRPQRS